MISMTAPATVVDIGSLLERTPGVVGGDLCLKGTRITIENVAMRYQTGITAEEMAAGNPDLSPALFHAGIAYYLANRALVDARIEKMVQWEERERKKFPNGVTSENAHLLELPDW
ncbi:MAG: hypothetical protein C0506_01270 [Anaerolinea sp.]|nr:hypothetical protein [Anaerolinea sp.]